MSASSIRVRETSRRTPGEYASSPVVPRPYLKHASTLHPSRT
jgi:hypothetical protein